MLASVAFMVSSREDDGGGGWGGVLTGSVIYPFRTAGFAMECFGVASTELAAYKPATC